MAMAALREASRCLASRRSPAAARPLFLSHSRGITYKLFVGGWLVVLIAHLLTPTPHPVCPFYVLIRRALCSVSLILLVEGARLLCG